MTTHGQTWVGGRTRTYRIWARMKQRCTNPNDEDYPYYGGRGITVCESWRSFANFFADMGHAPPEMTLERLNVNGPYSKENCKWATRQEQNRNKRTSRWFEVNGAPKLAIDIERELGLSPGAISMRLKMGWSVERAITTVALNRRKPRRTSKKERSQ